ncbi:RIP metalloprotease RseP [Melioribacteraceae bacterium 4301-Me]|uniref:RIP metalloprotease RseP n=1 Tax=Pyranulibacter aquaticus TaxID=3163344 RepID=UPI00359A7462
MEYIIYFVITIGILVFVHEFGHFAAAKITKMRVDVFAIGFGKRLFGWNKLTGFTFGDLPKDFDGQGNTDYRLSLLPLGGYVKIAGMVDESFDTQFADKEPQPYEFRSKPTIQKLFVITAGVMMNLTLTLGVFWGINFFQGKQIFKSTTISRIEKDSFAEKAGFNSYDKILSVNDKPVKNWEDIFNYLLVSDISANATVLVERNGKKVELNIPRSLITKYSHEGFLLFPYPTQPIIQEVMNNSPADSAGIKIGDIFLSLNGIAVTDKQQVVDIISSNKGKKISLTYLRGQDTLHTLVRPSSEGKIGIAVTNTYTGDYEYTTYGVIGSLTQAVKNIGQYTYLTLSMLKNVIVGKVAFNQAFGGPVKIAQYAARSADTGAISFLYFLAMLSLSLAIINILPFPVLDGGHFVIILLEGIFRKELPLKVKVAIQNTGFIILLLLMAFIIYSDIISL